VRTVGPAVAACVLLALTAGCGAGVMNSASATAVSRVAAPPQAVPPVAIADRPAKFGERRAASESLLVTVSAPKSFVPGDTAYPRAVRAVAFEVAIENQGSRTYRPSQLIVKATTADGRAMAPLVDNAQGYTGALGPEIPPGRSTRIIIAFAMPPDPVDIRVTFQPDGSAVGARAEFEGIA
jgi:hypothetical protein